MVLAAVIKHSSSCPSLQPCQVIAYERNDTAVARRCVLGMSGARDPTQTLRRFPKVCMVKKMPCRSGRVP